MEKHALSADKVGFSLINPVYLKKKNLYYLRTQMKIVFQINPLSLII